MRSMPDEERPAGDPYYIQAWSVAADRPKRDRAAIPHSSASTGKIITGSSDRQLVGMAAEGITEAAYQVDSEENVSAPWKKKLVGRDRIENADSRIFRSRPEIM
jgi:hypothetical protein